MSKKDVTRTRATLTMSECHKRPQCVEHQARAYQTVDVQFSKVLYRRYSLLIRAVYVLLQSPSDVFKYLIYNGYGESGMIALQVVGQHCKQTDVAVFDFPRFCENLVQRALYNRIIPIQFPDELEHLVNAFLDKKVEYEMANEQFDWSSFLLDARGTLWGIALDG